MPPVFGVDRLRPLATVVRSHRAIPVYQGHQWRCITCGGPLSRRTYPDGQGGFRRSNVYAHLPNVQTLA